MDFKTVSRLLAYISIPLMMVSCGCIAHYSPLLPVLACCFSYSLCLLSALLILENSSNPTEKEAETEMFKQKEKTKTADEPIEPCATMRSFPKETNKKPSFRGRAPETRKRKPNRFDEDYAPDSSEEDNPTDTIEVEFKPHRDD